MNEAETNSYYVLYSKWNHRDSEGGCELPILAVCQPKSKSKSIIFRQYEIYATCICYIYICNLGVNFIHSTKSYQRSKIKISKLDYG